jgi:hypothetical protein
MNELLKPPVTITTPIVSTRSVIVSSRMWSSVGFFSCRRVATAVQEISSSEVIANVRSAEVGRANPSAMPAATVIARAATVR